MGYKEQKGRKPKKALTCLLCNRLPIVAILFYSPVKQIPMDTENQANRDNSTPTPKAKPTPEESKAALDALTSSVASISHFGIPKPNDQRPPVAQKQPNSDVADFIKEVTAQQASTPETADRSAPTPTPATPPAALAAAPVAAPVAAPAAAPSADLEQPAAPESDELATAASKRPLAHFGQALPATKSKANRKLVLQLTPEEYQFFALVVALPDLNGVALPDLARAVLKAWRDDYRPDIKKAAIAAFKV